MSHFAAGLPPHVVSFTPGVLQTPGNSVITVTGARLSSTCKLIVPEALGTLISEVPTLSSFSTTTATATWTINVKASTNVTYTLKVTNGGLDASGTAIEIFHGFNPATLLNNDGTIFESTDTTNANPQTSPNQWNPSTSHTSGSGSGPFTWSGGHPARLAYITGSGGEINRAFFNDYNAGGDNLFSGTVNIHGGPWTVGFVVDVPQAMLNASSSYLFRIYHYSSEFGAGFKTQDDGTLKFLSAARSRNLTHATHTTSSGGIYSVIATHDGPASGIHTTKLYVNGVLKATSAYSNSYYGSGGTGLSINSPDISGPTNDNTPKLGDMFFKSGELSATEVENLHDYWASKFGF